MKQQLYQWSVLLACTTLAALVSWRLLVPLSPQTIPLGSRSRCAAYDGVPLGWRKRVHAGMVRIKGGEFEFGSQRGSADEGPEVKTHVAAFWIDRTEVTNAQFAHFAAATDYLTDAERGNGTVIFVPPRDAARAALPASWRHFSMVADWRHPEGPDSNLNGRANDPVVNVTYADALAYAHWLGRQLPTEAQWEFAAKAGLSNAESDRALRDARGQPQANLWRDGVSAQDKKPDRMPVGCFPANPDGLYDMVGNVWEWTSDVFRDRHYTDPAAAETAHAWLGASPDAAAHVVKGGSFLCAERDCARASSRQSEEAELPASNLGFRTVAPAQP